MAMLTASQISQSFGAVDIFSNVSVSIPNDGKIGLVGPNGVGKTTLLLILAGLASPSTGKVSWTKGKRLGYIPQEAAQAFAGQQHSVYEEMLAVFDELRKSEAKLRQMEAEMSRGQASEKLIERYGIALEQFELAGGYDYEVRIKRILQGLGFDREDWHLKLNHLSGGQKTRLLLARLLLEKPELLILDEPTNHLDVQAIEWLEGTLNIWQGALLLVSHDRYFMDRVINTIWEMGQQQIEEYRGNYSAYVQQRQERWTRRRQAYESRRQHLEKELDYIRRNIAGQRTQMAKGKLSRISRELEAIKKAGLEGTQGKSWSQISEAIGGASRRSMSVAEAAAAIKQLQMPDGNHQSFNISLKKGQRSGHIVLRAKDLTIGYADKALFTAPKLDLYRQECAALIGPNGSGKTTFLKTILGRQEPLAGEYKLGASLDIAYFTQAHEQLNPKNRVIDELMGEQNMLLSEARKYLARHMFRGDDVYKRVSALSGGERGRLALAILALTGANFLLLDEPTNHLDIPAREMLQEMLEQFEGTILLVSHDRYLVDHLASQLWLLQDGRLEVFKGRYRDYLQERELAQEKLKKIQAKKRKADQRKKRMDKNVVKSSKKLVQKLVQVEKEVAELESRLASLASDLQRAAGQETFDKIQSLSIEYAAVEGQLEKQLEEWENLARESSLA
jgi:ATP-binding cassette subfamily F protein 3